MLCPLQLLKRFNCSHCCMYLHCLGVNRVPAKHGIWCLSDCNSGKTENRWRSTSAVFSAVTVKWGSCAGDLVPIVKTEERLKCQSQLGAFPMWQCSHKLSEPSAPTSRPSEMGFGKWKTILGKAEMNGLYRLLTERLQDAFLFCSAPLL